MDIDDLAPGMYVRVTGFRGVACYVRKLETTPERTCDACDGHGTIEDFNDEPCACEACDGIGYRAEELTGRVVVTMVGDDGRHVVDPEDCQPLASDEFCRECGQIGCSHAIWSDD